VNRRLKAKIVERFGTQSDFSEAIKTQESTISRVVRGRRELNEEDKKAWAKALGAELAILFNFEEK